MKQPFSSSMLKFKAIVLFLSLFTLGYQIVMLTDKKLFRRHCSVAYPLVSYKFVASLIYNLSTDVNTHTHAYIYNHIHIYIYIIYIMLWMDRCKIPPVDFYGLPHYRL